MQQLLPCSSEWLSETPDPDLGLLQLRRLAEGRPGRRRSRSTFRDSPGAAERAVPPPRLEPAGRRRAAPPARVRRRARRRRRCSPREAPRDRAGRRRARHARLARRRRAAARGAAPLQAPRAAAHRARATSSGSRRLEATGRELADAGRRVRRGRAAVARAAAARSRSSAWAASAAASCRTRPTSTCSSSTTATSAADFDDAEQVADARSSRRSARPPPRARRSASTPASGPRASRARWPRSLDGFRAYYEQWALTWELQALTKARLVAGDADARRALLRARGRVTCTATPFPDDDVREIRRMKARIERERIPPGEDPQFHLKLGAARCPTSSSPCSCCSSLHGGEHPDAARPGDDRRARRLRADVACSTPTTPTSLEEAYRFCERARNAPLPADRAAVRRAAHRQRRARAPGPAPRATCTGPHSTLRDDYRRVTRRARARRRARLLRHLMTTPELEAVGGARRHRVGARAVRGRPAIAFDRTGGRRLPPVRRRGLDRAADPRHRAPPGAPGAVFAVRLVPSRAGPLLPPLAPYRITGSTARASLRRAHPQRRRAGRHRVRRRSGGAASPRARSPSS